MSENQENMAEKVALKDENRISWRDVLSGKMVLKPRVVKQYRVVLLVFFLCVLYVGNRLECERQERDIVQLQEDLKYQQMVYHMRIRTLNEEMSLEKVMEKLKKVQLELEVPKTPPFTYY